MRTRRRWTGAVAVLLLLGILAACGRTDSLSGPGAACSPQRDLTPGTATHTMRHAGQQRSYALHVPPGYDGVTRLPVVFMFHGYGGDPVTLLRTTRMADLADDQNALVVAPLGRGEPTAWDFRSPRETEGSDIDFVAALVDEIASDLCADTTRTYAAGFSNGSALALALACDGKTPFAAYGAVSAPFIGGSCEGAPPASVIYFGGMKDKVVPYGGGGTIIGALPSVSDVMSRWAAHDRCPPAGATTVVSEHVRHYAWTSCDADTAVEVYAVENGGHRWPGGRPGERAQISGLQTQEIDASRLMWEFFEKHPARIGL